MESIKEVLGNDDKLKIIGFGTFAVSNQKERKGRNPQTGEEIKIPERKVVRFKPGKNLKEEIISS
jgi:DNA-binding protein HU-beta